MMQAQNLYPIKTLRLPCLLATAIFIVYAVLLSCKSVAGFPVSHFTCHHWPWLGDKPTGEDGFYMLTVSDNLAATHRLVYNYGRPATGIQPLAVIIFSFVAWFTHALHLSEWDYIRVLLFFNSVLFVCFCWQISYIAKLFSTANRSNLVFFSAFFLAICDFTLFRLFTYGLETGIYLVCTAALYRHSICVAKKGKASWKDVIAIGVMGGVSGLARIDFGIIFAIVLAFFFIRRTMENLQILLCGITAMLIVSPWFHYVHTVSGFWTPSSGHAESRRITFESLGRISSMAYAASSHVFPWAFNPGVSGYPLFVLASLACIAFLVYKIPAKNEWCTVLKDYCFFITPWLIGFLLLDCVYVVFFWSEHFYTRYSSPLIILSIPALALVLAEQKWISIRPGFWIVPLVTMFLVFDVLSLHMGHVGSSQLINAGYIHEHYPSAHVGSFQSGTEGYFNRNVDNLDGKLNTEALQAAQTQQMPEYINRADINVLVDWPGYIYTLPRSYLVQDWTPCPYPMPTSDSVCLIRKANQ